MALSSLFVVANANRLRAYRAAVLPDVGMSTEHVNVEVNEHTGEKENRWQRSRTLSVAWRSIRA